MKGWFCAFQVYFNIPWFYLSLSFEIKKSVLKKMFSQSRKSVRRKESMSTFALAYYLIINVVTFIAYGADKSAARNHRWRTRESVLLGLSAAGGAFGGLLAMAVFHHKTRHTYFWIVNGLAIAVHLVIIVRLIQG
jgi:uncharacterized membrane protein YsdA (DUF1294 family)